LEFRLRGNVVRYRSFRQMLDDAITRYNSRTIQAADVVAVMVEMRRQQQEDQSRKRELGLSDEELAFYDVVALGTEVGLPASNEWIAGLVREVVVAMRANLKVDWTKAHRRDVYAGVESAVKLVLRRRRIKGEAFEFLRRRLMQQAEVAYADWPLAA
jgi:type I restriction enzyme, R subunit